MSIYLPRLEKNEETNFLFQYVSKVMRISETDILVKFNFEKCNQWWWETGSLFFLMATTFFSASYESIDLSDLACNMLVFGMENFGKNVG